MMHIFFIEQDKPHRRKTSIDNAIVSADDDDMARKMAEGILRGDRALYTVTPITEPGDRTVLVVAAEVFPR